jgi:hypothetical protein
MRLLRSTIRKCQAAEQGVRLYQCIDGQGERPDPDPPRPDLSFEQATRKARAQATKAKAVKAKAEAVKKGDFQPMNDEGNTESKPQDPQATFRRPDFMPSRVFESILSFDVSDSLPRV